MPQHNKQQQVPVPHGDASVGAGSLASDASIDASLMGVLVARASGVVPLAKNQEMMKKKPKQATDWRAAATSAQINAAIANKEAGTSEPTREVLMTANQTAKLQTLDNDVEDAQQTLTAMEVSSSLPGAAEEIPGAFAVPGLASHHYRRTASSISSTTEAAEEGAGAAVVDVEATAELAHAHLVEEEGPGHLQVAETELPRRAHRDKRKWSGKSFTIAFMILLLCVVGVIALVVGLVTKDGKKNSVRTTSDHRSKEAEELAIQMIVSNALQDQSLLQDPATPQHQAMQWILHDDPLELGFDAPNLLQRYALVLFYYSTTLEGPWMECNPPQGLANGDVCYYLYQFLEAKFQVGYGHLQTDHSKTLASRWLTGQHECDWAGLFCNGNDKVEWMVLDDMVLSGSLPAELSILDELKGVTLSGNALQGSLPESMLSELRYLEYLDLSENSLQGTIPQEWWHSRSLQLRYLDLSHNPFDSWTIPADIGTTFSPSTLEGLWLANSGITGSIPPSLYELTSLRWLGLRYNDITGTLATEIGLLSSYLEMVSFQDVLFSGTLPSEVALLTSHLLELDVWGTGLTGTIPEELYLADFVGLNALIFSHNLFFGTISTNIARLSTLGYLLLSHNPHLTGTIPTELAVMPELYKITVDATGLTGTMPAEVCANRGDSFLVRVKADCEELSDGTTPLFCPLGCCTNCCNRETGICTKTGY